MKATVIETRSYSENEFENRINAVVRYNNNSIAVSITTYHDFNGSKPVIKYINSFRYISSVKRQSVTRDREIQRALKGIEY